MFGEIVEPVALIVAGGTSIDFDHIFNDGIRELVSVLCEELLEVFAFRFGSDCVERETEPLQIYTVNSPVPTVLKDRSRRVRTIQIEI